MDNLTILIIIALSLSNGDPVSSLVGYRCSSNSPTIKTLSSIDVPECALKQRNFTEIETRIQLIQPRVFDETPFFSCLVEIRHLIFRCGRSIDTFQRAALSTEILSLTESECKDLAYKGSFGYDGIKIKIDSKLDKNFISTETFGSINEGSCTPGNGGAPFIFNGITYDRAVRTSEFEITIKKGLATVDVEEKKIMLPNGDTCLMSEENCFTADSGFVFWKKPFSHNYCKGDQYIVIFEGSATKITDNTLTDQAISYIVHYNDYDFQLTLISKEKRVCGLVAKLTEHPKLAIIEIKEGSPLVYEPEKIGKNINLMTYTNSKLLYVVKDLKTQLNSLYHALSHDRCITEIRVAKNMLSIARMNPQEFIYSYMGSSGYSAVIRGEAIYITQCEPISVNITNLNDNKCYNEIPVSRNNVNYFLHPILDSVRAAKRLQSQEENF